MFSMLSNVLVTRHMNERGVSLVELLVTVGISSIAIVAALSLALSATHIGHDADGRQEMADELSLLRDFFSREIPTGGGNGVPVEGAYWVEDNCSARSVFPDCQQSDRLSIVFVKDQSVCPINSFDQTTGIADLNDPSDPTLPCCLTSVDLLHSHAMLTSGTTYAQTWVDTVTTSTCRVHMVAGPFSPHDNVTYPFNWSGGTLVPIELKTYYVDLTTGSAQQYQLLRYNYDSIGTSSTSGSTQVLVDRLLDFQIALGFDFNPADGVLDDTNADTDEWLFNGTAGGEARDNTLFSAASGTTLRMISIGSITGLRTWGGAIGLTKTKVLNGPDRNVSGWILQSSVMKTGLRTLYEFQ